jgi:hypothetical protein
MTVKGDMFKFLGRRSEIWEPGNVYEVTHVSENSSELIRIKCERPCRDVAIIDLTHWEKV